MGRYQPARHPAAGRLRLPLAGLRALRHGCLRLMHIGTLLSSLAMTSTAQDGGTRTQATPSAETAMFYFQTNELKFTAEFLGRVRLVGSVASLIGVGCYNFCLKVRAVDAVCSQKQQSRVLMALKRQMRADERTPDVVLLWTRLSCSRGSSALFLHDPQDVPLRRMFTWTAVIGSALGLTQILLVTGAS